ncbi:MAG: hydroxymethylglutaryl-CoA synthase [Candidatus Aenigmarchaeota archaeon]|nr:hydroxymethylglutaryl-CoA synthase [Candidatus Aenigmarchaeota archaeon]
MIGIVGYGGYIPRFRIKVEEIASVWNADAKAIKSGLNIEEKSVPSMDEDTATIAVEAALNALKMAEIDPKEIGAIYVGSESHPYAVKPTATIVGEAIGCGAEFTAADTEFACKAGTAGIQMVMGLIEGGYIKFGLAIGSDTAQSKPGDALEYTASAGGAAFILGKNNVIGEIEGTFSFSSDTPDFWRRDGIEYPSHGGRFTGIPAYFKHVVSATQGLMKKLGLKSSDFDHVVFHMPNGKFPINAAKMLGFDLEKLKAGFVVSKIGNTYSASSLLGLAAILDVAKPGQRILITSYGSGAGSDAFSIKVTDLVEEKRKKTKKIQDYIDDKEYVTYAHYTRLRRGI